MTLADSGAAPSSDVAIVRPMSTDDVAFAAALHKTTLPHGFFGRLGHGFLTRYYQSFVESPHAVAFVAQSAAGPQGILVGTVRNGAHYAWVLRGHGLALAVRGTAALLGHPRQMVFFVRTRLAWYLGGLFRFGWRAAARRWHGMPAVDCAPPPAVLTHVAVTPFARGGGIGAGLVDRFLESARLAGCREAVLVTFAGPEGAGRFYRRLGWSRRDTHHNHDGRLVECYDRRL
ncbi:MAG: GNAT family N-acetyltransferase [Nitriliruptorales bacterium]|nr:GNAT family N-acetyltransferase [Nitriliruptorales bacterium]